MEFLPIKKIGTEKNKYMRKVIQLSALFFLGSTVIIGCKKKEKNLGLSVQPQSDQLSVNVVDSSKIIFYSVKEDSLRVDELDGPNMLGSYVDPYFGKMSASIISQIRLQSSVDFSASSGSLDSLVIDSVVMYLALESYYGTLENQTFEVYQIGESIDIDSSYYTTTIIPTTGSDLVAGGGSLIKPNPINTGFVEGQPVDQAILRIPLSINDFGWKIMNESGNTSLLGNDGSGEFIDWYKGLMIKVNNPGQPSGQGCILYVDMIDPFSKVTMFYRDTTGVSSEHDTIAFDFNFNANCARFHSVETDYTGTSVESELNDSTNGTDMFFLQALGGVKAKVAFPFIEGLKTDSNKIINKAELILPFQFYDGDPYTPSSSLLITRKNDDDKDVFLPDVNEGGHGGNVDFSSNTYTFNITRYINKVLSGDYENKPLTLITNGSGITANRTILNGYYTSNKDKPKLVLTYTKY